MQQTPHDSSPPRYRGEVTRPLPSSLADSLAPTTRHALMHETRRRILRALNVDPTPRTTQDLVTALPGVTHQTISYHVLVLEQCGSLTVSRVERNRGHFVRFVVSNVADNLEFLSTLMATERLDDAR